MVDSLLSPRGGRKLKNLSLFFHSLVGLATLLAARASLSRGVPWVAAIKNVTPDHCRSSFLGDTSDLCEAEGECKDGTCDLWRPFQ